MYEKNVNLDLKIQELPEYLKRDALDYIDFLLHKYKDKKMETHPLQFDWEGGLSELKGQFTSVELQHNINR